MIANAPDNLITRKQYISDYINVDNEFFIRGIPESQQNPKYKSAKKKIHEDYYRQFVTDQTLDHVRAQFDVEALAAALKVDEHLNSIDLEVWDRLTWHPTNENPRPEQYTSARGASGPFQSHLPINDEMIALTGERVSRSTLVCIAKQAARMLVENAAQVVENAAQVVENAAQVATEIKTTTTTVVVQIQIEVATRHDDDDLTVAAEEMTKNITNYLPITKELFETDYGVSRDKLAKARATGNWDDVTWGGYEGPYAVDIVIERIPS